MNPPLVTAPESPAKRPRSPSDDLPPPAAKVAKTQAHHVQINYLARQHTENLPLVTADDSLPSVLRLLGEYDGVLHRHESIAGNLGACPLGPILIKRFERLFDAPPRILKTHGKDIHITWLDVVDFARNKPEQFNLEKTRNGVRVCQFYTKQSRVEISEEDYVLIASGMPQKLIPPQPIPEDEEKELGAIEILEKNLAQVVQMADQVSARARQLNHKLKTRKAAIMSRRDSDSDVNKMQGVKFHGSPIATDDINGINMMNATDPNEKSQSPPTGFTAVNIVKPPGPIEVTYEVPPDASPPSANSFFSSGSMENVTIINGQSVKGASPTLRARLMEKFFSSSGQEGHVDEERRVSIHSSRPAPISVPPLERRSDSLDSNVQNQNESPAQVAIPGTPASLLPQVKPATTERDDGGPFKAEMVARMELMHRGERIMPPCDRCRRLHMDCLKNLTACQGCTKKHAKCSWKDVVVDELHNGRLSPSAAVESNGDARPVGSGSDAAPSPVLAAQPSTAALGSTQGASRLMIDPGEPADAIEPPKSRIDTNIENMAPSRTTIASSTAKFDLRPPPIDQRARSECMPSSATTSAAGRGQFAAAGGGSRGYLSPVQKSIEQDESDEGDRLQALAAQVYRSASQSVRPQEG